MAVFVGLASAQVGTIGGSSFSPFNCSVSNVTVTPNLRSEGFTEETGDIVLVCTGGSPVPVGAQIPTVSITVFYNVPAVTSRLLGNTTAGASEALLLIDEPNNGGPQSESGYGPSLPQIVCTTPLYGAGPNGCPQWVGSTSYGGPGVPVSGSSTSTTPGANVFQGIVSAASVTFQGIPVLPPVSSGLARVYRITNVRVNANGAGGGLNGGPGQVNASISVSPAGSLPITNPNPIVGYINQGMKGNVANGQTFNQCVATTGFSALLNFVEQFSTAFKTRVDGLNGKGVSNQDPTLRQNIPGQPYNSESNFIMNGTGGNGTLTVGSYTAGLADYGTRLKAIFSNVPAGATVYVSTTNVTNSSGSAGINAVAAPNATTTATSYAVLLTSETAADGTTSSAAVPAATVTNSFTGTSSSSNPSSAVNYVAMTSTGAPIVAVWEVVNTQPTFTETMTFSVFFGYSGVTQTFPPAGTSQVELSLAPNATSNAFSVTNGGTTAVNNLIPRFADLGTNSTFASINLCSTTLLFPYVTTVTGFTTGISIANTTTDPFKTTPQAGTCTLNWYNAPTANPAASTTPSIASGGIWVQDISTSAYAGQNFSGYMIAVCNFQLAHGVAIVQDIGAQRILSAYLALVVTTGTGARNSYTNTSPEALNN
jgi:hypothetical protein